VLAAPGAAGVWLFDRDLSVHGVAGVQPLEQVLVVHEAIEGTRL
jgi:hypothetical protein